MDLQFNSISKDSPSFSMNKNIICIISGPTASGKTSTSIELAKKIGGEIVNFDSLLFYKELNIGTAKPSQQEMDSICHHMIDTHSARSAINAADYIKEALPIINELHNQDKIVYLVGGSGFYLQALLYGMFESSTTPDAIIQKSNDLYQKEGIEPFLTILEKKDPISFEKYHANDHYRVRRAVEHFWTTGKPFADSRSNMESKREEGPMNKLGWKVFHAYLDVPKEDHWEIIQKRTEKMIQEGLLDEVKTLLAQGFSGQEKPLKSIGYKEAQEFLSGNLLSKSEMAEKISIATRQLAKSQRTWFKKQPKSIYNPLTDKEKLFQDVMSFLKEL
jgi:tRNA dimethylallyltransferase